MKTVTVEKFLTFNPCWLDEEGGEERLREIGLRKNEWTAMDVLALEEVSACDRLWAVLREDFISKNVLYEFARLCAEHALTIAGVTDERLWNAINVKRAWTRGEATDDELYLSMTYIFDVEWDIAQILVWSDVYSATCAATRVVEHATNNVKKHKSYNAERAWQIETLKRLIVEDEKEETN